MRTDAGDVKELVSLWYVEAGKYDVSPDELTVGSHVVGAEFQKEGHGDRHEAVGTALLHIDDDTVAKAPWN